VPKKDQAGSDLSPHDCDLTNLYYNIYIYKNDIDRPTSRFHIQYIKDD
jgi:hypothetical protein